MNLKELKNQKTEYKVLDSTYVPNEKTKEMIGDIFEEKKGATTSLWNKDKSNFWNFSLSELQEMTPLEYKGVRIGIGDEVYAYGEWLTVYGYCWFDGEFMLETVRDNDFENSCDSLSISEITDHRPLKSTNTEAEQAIETLKRLGRLNGNMIIE